MRKHLAFAVLLLASCAPVQTQNLEKADSATNETRSFVNLGTSGIRKGFGRGLGR